LGEKSHLTTYRQWVPIGHQKFPKKSFFTFWPLANFWLIPLVDDCQSTSMTKLKKKKKKHKKTPACSLLFYWQNFAQKNFFGPFYDIAKVMIIHRKV
jgi:hypothetical protein